MTDDTTVPTGLIIPAHAVTQIMTLVETYPDHEPREYDPHYHVFRETRARLERLGLLRCWIDNDDCSTGPVELHHALVEFALMEIVDVPHFCDLYPEFAVQSDDEFREWVESEGNLLPLCTIHHRGVLGIHCIHYPAWLLQRFVKPGICPPERKVLMRKPHKPHRPHKRRTKAEMAAARAQEASSAPAP